jgi:hypothetical protein
MPLQPEHLAALLLTPERRVVWRQVNAPLVADAGGFRLMEECLLWVEMWSRYATSHSAGIGASSLCCCQESKWARPVCVLACRFCNLAMQLQSAHSDSSLAAGSYSLASSSSCLLSQFAEGKTLVSAVATGVLTWLHGMAFGGSVGESDASPNKEARQSTAFASAFRPSPELVRL